MNAPFHDLPSTAPSDLPLVLLPGSLCDERLFAPLLERLPGRVAQTVSLEGDTVEQAAASVLADAPARFALLGFSLGGIVALEVALLAPERVGGLALLDTNARACAKDVEPSPPMEAVAEAWPRYVATGRLDDAQLRYLVEAMARDVDPERHRAQQAMVRERRDKRGRLASLDMPALVLAGADDALCPPAFQREMAEELPRAALALIPGAGHFALLEGPDSVAAHVAAWLARVDADAQTHASPRHH